MTNGKADTVLLTGRRALVTTLVSIALNPLSILLGYYVGHTLQRPHLVIQYARALPTQEIPRIDPDLHRRVRRDALLTELIEKALQPYDCDEWPPKEGTIDPGCVPDYLSAMETLQETVAVEREKVESNISVIKAWTPEHELVLTPVSLPDLNEPIQEVARRNKVTALDILQSFLNSLRPMETELKDLMEAVKRVGAGENSRRTGEATFSVGVLNAGDSDGVIYPDATVQFGDSSLAAKASRDEGYTVIKGHSFARIDLTIDGKETRAGDLEKWRALLKNRQQEEFSVSLTGSSGSLSREGRLPP